MSDRVVVTGDQAVFDVGFGAATVTAAPGIITGSSRAKMEGATVCVVGDEASVVVTGAVYVTAGFPVPGSGVLTISSLSDGQEATRASSSQRAAILVGARFNARFQVTAPASNSTSSDSPGRVYAGSGRFVSANHRVRAT
jgi:hypothetical protein